MRGTLAAWRLARSKPLPRMLGFVDGGKLGGLRSLPLANHPCLAGLWPARARGVGNPRGVGISSGKNARLLATSGSNRTRSREKWLSRPLDADPSNRSKSLLFRRGVEAMLNTPAGDPSASGLSQSTKNPALRWLRIQWAAEP